MKNQIIASLILLVGFVCFQSCENSADAAKKVIPPVIEETVFTPSVEDTIGLAKFRLWKTNWHDNAISFLTANSPDILNSFTVKKVDMTEVMGEGPTQVRYYLGLEAGRDGGGWTPHLMIVGVNASGADMIDTAQGQYVYDMVCPCPSRCGEICR